MVRAKQVAADASKLVEMIDTDKKPAFLDRVDLDQLADLPEVFLAELMMDFFPSKDPAPGHGPDPAPHDRLPGAADDVARPMSGGRAGGGIHVFGLNVLPGLARGTHYAERARNAADAIGSRAAAAMTAPSMKNLARLRSNLRETLWGAVGAEAGRGNHDDGVRDDDDRDGRECANGNQPDDEASSNIQNPTQMDAQTMWDAMLARGPGSPGRRVLSRRGGRGRGVVQQVAPPGATLRKPASRKEERLKGGMAWAEETGVQTARAATLEERPQEQSAPGGAKRKTSRRRIKHHVSFPSDMEAVRHDDDAVGDDLSAAELRWQGNITVYIPRAPEPGAWAASVTVNPRESIAWVLSEALRMYAREHDPVPRYSGLARKPRLTSRSRRWGLRSSSSEWVQTAALPETASVGSVLCPGEELVVLVEGFQPSMAFGSSPSVCFASPSPTPLPQIEEGSTTGMPEENGVPREGVSCPSDDGVDGDPV